MERARPDADTVRSRHRMRGIAVLLALAAFATLIFAIPGLALVYVLAMFATYGLLSVLTRTGALAPAQVVADLNLPAVVVVVTALFLAGAWLRPAIGATVIAVAIIIGIGWLVARDFGFGALTSRPGKARRTDHE